MFKLMDKKIVTIKRSNTCMCLSKPMEEFSLRKILAARYDQEFILFSHDTLRHLFAGYRYV